MQIKDKSKKMIVNSFLNLTVHNEFNEISIEEIIINSGLSRGTFYNHFRNKNDIIIYLEKIMCKSIDDAFEDISPDNENYMSIMTHRILPLVYENREYTKILYQYYQPSFFDFIVKRYSKYFIKYFENYDEKVLKLSRDFAVQFFFRMMLNAMLLWISEAIPPTPEEFEPSFKKIINSSVSDVCGISIQ
ncbi:hypothetical protein AKUH4B504J_01260 [Apilactobacillus kunkeei]|uniref:TetR/AcrR family transcriptional regulator n=1 Tax=Apilactobacillus kunkeei TaxID=148814 RepID=UPI0021E2CE30|nr:hypothetical protein AKUH4B504J_01260 [Apilactobacillus kunkeei]